MFNLVINQKSYFPDYLSFFNLKNKEKVESIMSSYLIFKKNTGGIVWNGVYVCLMPVGRKHWAGELCCI